MSRESKYDNEINVKANAPLAIKLRNMIRDTKTATELKDYLGVSIQAINQYKQGTAYPKTENLIKIADYFGISVDYLLNLTDVPNRDTSIQSVNSVTGLSVGAICKLHDLKEKNPSFSLLISAIIEDSNFEYFLSIIEELVEKSGDAQIDYTTVNIRGKKLRLSAVDHLKAVFQNQIIENLPRVSVIYYSLKSKVG